MKIDKVTGTWREKIQYATACVAFASGLTLAYLQYFQQGDISNGTLGFVAQTLVYAASIFGVGLYIQSKFGEIKNYIEKKEYERPSNHKSAEDE